MEIRGVIVPLITPMDGNERLNTQALRALIDFLIKEVFTGYSFWGAPVSSLLSIMKRRLKQLKSP